MKSTPFVVIFYPRTGSTYLVKVLNSCSNIICHSELFQVDVKAFKRAFLDEKYIPEVRDWFKQTKDLDKLFKYRNRFPVSFLNKIYSMDTEKSIGFKFYPKQGKKTMNHLLDDKNIKKIFIHRENLLNNFVSHKLASKTGKWDRYEGETPKLNTVKIDIPEFKKFEAEQSQYYDVHKKRLDNSGQSFLEVSYEQVTSNFPIADFENFLDTPLNDISFEVNQKKQNPFTLQQMIENFDEVNEELIKSGKTFYVA